MLVFTHIFREDVSIYDKAVVKLHSKEMSVFTTVEKPVGVFAWPGQNPPMPPAYYGFDVEEVPPAIHPLEQGEQLPCDETHLLLKGNVLLCTKTGSILKYYDTRTNRWIGPDELRENAIKEYIRKGGAPPPSP